MRDSNRNQSLLELNIPTIVVLHREGEHPPCPSLITDNKRIGQMAAEHFLDRGYTNFAFCGYDDLIWSQERAKSFTQQIHKEGHKVFIYQQPYTRRARQWENEQKVLANWLQSCPKPLALFACNDDRGISLIETCKAADISVPDEVAILGVDNDELFCTLCDIPLSSIALDIEKTGYEAARLLDQLMSGEQIMDCQQILTKPTHVVVRQSTDILALDDQDVIKAIQFIRNNSAKSIQVGNVVSATGLSRRVLEKRFRQYLKRSIFEEIRKNRIKKSIEMLIGTDLSVADISKKLDFPGIEQFSRYFRQGTGLSPSEYRKNFGFQ